MSLSARAKASGLLSLPDPYRRPASTNAVLAEGHLSTHTRCLGVLFERAGNTFSHALERAGEKGWRRDAKRGGGDAKTEAVEKTKR